jgi:hypothetical protein
MPTVSRHSPLQGTWETKCVIEWSREDVYAWLDSIEWSHLFSVLKKPRGIDLAMTKHQVMRDAIQEPEASYLFNAVGVLIEEHKGEYADRASALQHCIKTRGKALPFSRKRVISLYGVNFACIVRDCR